jgi:hypothetical protein
MITYLIFDGVLFKIGQTQNINNRMNQFYTSNPFVILLGHSDKISESELHDIYRYKRIKNEWFNLTKNDVKKILYSFKYGKHPSLCKILFCNEFNFDKQEIRNTIMNEIDLIMNENKKKMNVWEKLELNIFE